MGTPVTNGAEVGTPVFKWGRGDEGFKTLPTAQRSQGMEYFDSFDTFSSEQKLRQASAESCLAEICLDLFCLSNLSLVLFGKGREIYRTI